jgi:WD domain, G-beta repeat
MRTLESPNVRAASFSEDGRFLAIAGGGSLSVFSVDTGDLLTRFGEHSDEEGDTYTGIGLSRDGARLVTASLGGRRAHVWDIGTREPVGPIPPVLDQSPDGGDVVTRGFRAIAAELSAGVEFRLQADPHPVLVHVAPDHRALLAIHPPWGKSHGAEVSQEFTLPDGHHLFVDPVPCVRATFSPDSRHVLSARADGSIDVSPARATDDVVERARQHVFRPLGADDRRTFAL